MSNNLSNLHKNSQYANSTSRNMILEYIIPLRHVRSTIKHIKHIYSEILNRQIYIYSAKIGFTD